LKLEVKKMPKSTFTITGDIKDFSRVDNVYAALKREVSKALKNWSMKIDISHEESQGEGEIPE